MFAPPPFSLHDTHGAVTGCGYPSRLPPAAPEVKNSAHRRAASAVRASAVTIATVAVSSHGHWVWGGGGSWKRGTAERAEEDLRGRWWRPGPRRIRRPPAGASRPGSPPTPPPPGGAPERTALPRGSPGRRPRCDQQGLVERTKPRAEKRGGEVRRRREVDTGGSEERPVCTVRTHAIADSSAKCWTSAIRLLTCVAPPARKRATSSGSGRRSRCPGVGVWRAHLYPVAELADLSVECGQLGRQPQKAPVAAATSCDAERPHRRGRRPHRRRGRPAQATRACRESADFDERHTGWGC